jgi:hypothetical protein
VGARIYQVVDRKRVGTIAEVTAPVYSVALDANGKAKKRKAE